MRGRMGKTGAAPLAQDGWGSVAGCHVGWGVGNVAASSPQRSPIFSDKITVFLRGQLVDGCWVGAPEGPRTECRPWIGGVQAPSWRRRCRFRKIWESCQPDLWKALMKKQKIFLQGFINRLRTDGVPCMTLTLTLRRVSEGAQAMRDQNVSEWSKTLQNHHATASTPPDPGQGHATGPIVEIACMPQAC